MAKNNSDRKMKLAAVFTAVAGVLFAAGALTHNSGGVILIENGHPQAGLKVIDIFGAEKTGLNAELFAQVYAGDAEMTKALLDRGAKFDWTTGGAAIVQQHPEILSLLLDKDSSQVQSYLIGGIINKEGTVEILEVAKAHGAKVGFEALVDAARGRPDLLPWVIEHGSFAPTDVMQAQKAAVSNDHLESFMRLRALAEPDEATKAGLLALAVHNAATVDELLKTVPFGEAALRAGLVEALDRGQETSFNLLKARLPQSTVSEVIRATLANRDEPTQLLVREAAKLPVPQTFAPTPRR
ncbi:MAG TPA: hypothetical protein VL625_01930 [Patescibacteria group bacterium]|nr:hypothetical protein [Patescibacteria group bacterium]